MCDSQICYRSAQERAFNDARQLRAARETRLQTVAVYYKDPRTGTGYQNRCKISRLCSAHRVNSRCAINSAPRQHCRGFICCKENMTLRAQLYRRSVWIRIRDTKRYRDYLISVPYILAGYLRCILFVLSVSSFPGGRLGCFPILRVAKNIPLYFPPESSYNLMHLTYHACDAYAIRICSSKDTDMINPSTYFMRNCVIIAEGSFMCIAVSIVYYITLLCAYVCTCATLLAFCPYPLTITMHGYPRGWTRPESGVITISQ